MAEGKWQETIGHGFGTARKKGTTKKTEVLNEHNGRLGGYQIEHWDGRQDAEITPETYRRGSRVQTGE